MGWTVSDDYQIPSASLPCTFTAGVCQVSSSYILTDASQATGVWVSETTGKLASGSASVTVTPASASRIALANLAGGPTGKATAYSTALTITTDQALLDLYAAIVDSFGNYLKDAPSSTTWSFSSEVPSGALTSYLNSTTGAEIQLTPTKTGAASLLVSGASYTSPTYTTTIQPGIPSLVAIAPAAGTTASTVTAGVPIALALTLTDAKNNIITSTGTYAVTLGMDQATFTPDVSQGCNRYHVNGDNLYTSGAAGICGNRTVNLAFTNGALTTPLTVSLNYAYENYSATQTLSATVTLSGAASTASILTGSSAPFTPHIGAAERIELHRSASNDGSFLYTQATFETASPTWVDTAGDAPVTYYAILPTRRVISSATLLSPGPQREL